MPFLFVACYMKADEGQIILTSERLIFRQHIMADMDAFSAMEQDAYVRKYVGGKPRSKEEAERRFINGPLQPVKDRLGMWATILKTENKYIGRCGLYPHFGAEGKVVEDEATLAFYIAHEYWGNGFATEAGRAFISFGFNEIKIKRIVATIQDGNNASVHVMEKLAFTLSYTEKGDRSFHHFVLQNPAYQKGR